MGPWLLLPRREREEEATGRLFAPENTQKNEHQAADERTPLSHQYCSFFSSVMSVFQHLPSKNYEYVDKQRRCGSYESVFFTVFCVCLCVSEREGE